MAKGPPTWRTRGERAVYLANGADHASGPSPDEPTGQAAATRYSAARRVTTPTRTRRLLSMPTTCPVSEHDGRKRQLRCPTDDRQPSDCTGLPAFFQDRFANKAAHSPRSRNPYTIVVVVIIIIILSATAQPEPYPPP